VAQQKHKVSDREWGEIPGQPSHKGPWAPCWAEYYKVGNEKALQRLRKTLM
jgi:hypothetical protein